MTSFAPVGNGRVLVYLMAGDGEDLRYVRGTNILRRGDTRYMAVGDEILTGDFDLPPLAGATRAVVVDGIPELGDRPAVSGVYARSTESGASWRVIRLRVKIETSANAPAQAIRDRRRSVTTGDNRATRRSSRSRATASPGSQ